MSLHEMLSHSELTYQGVFDCIDRFLECGLQVVDLLHVLQGQLNIVWKRRRGIHPVDGHTVYRLHDSSACLPYKQSVRHEQEGEDVH